MNQILPGKLLSILCILCIAATGMHCKKDKTEIAPPQDHWDPVTTNRHRNIGEANWSFAINNKAFFGSKDGDLHIYDFMRKEWIGTFSWPNGFEPRWSCAVAVYNNKAYIGNGRSGNGQFLQDWWEFDPEASLPWRRLPNSPAAGADGTAFIHNGTIYTTLHIDELSGKETKQRHVYSFDIATETWNASFDELSANCGTSGFAFLLEGKLHFGTGYNNSVPGSIFTRECAVYDPAKKQTSTIAPFPVEMQRSENAITFTHNGKGYVLGTHNALYEYNPNSNQWRTMNKVPEVPEQGPITYLHRYQTSVYGLTTKGYVFEYVAE